MRGRKLTTFAFVLAASVAGARDAPCPINNTHTNVLDGLSAEMIDVTSFVTDGGLILVVVNPLEDLRLAANPWGNTDLIMMGSVKFKNAV